MTFLNVSEESLKNCFRVLKIKETNTTLFFNFGIVVIINYPFFKLLSLLEVV